MDVQDVFGHAAIKVAVLLIQNQEQQIETGQERRWQVDVFTRRLVLVVTTVDGVSSRQDGRASVQGGVDTSLPE